MEEKSELRRRMRSLNRSLTPSQRAAASRSIFAQVERLDAFAEARTIALFCSLPDEPDTAEPLARWLGARQLAVPRVESETMQFYRYDGITTETGAFGIAEPRHTDLCLPASIDLILVPGVAFTSEGYRMGRGKGFYDRYLAQPEVKARTVGICYAHQIVDRLPVEPHDIPVERVVFG